MSESERISTVRTFVIPFKRFLGMSTTCAVMPFLFKGLLVGWTDLGGFGTLKTAGMASHFNLLFFPIDKLTGLEMIGAYPAITVKVPWSSPLQVLTPGVLNPLLASENGTK